MTNLEYINSLPCSQRLKDRIIEETERQKFCNIKLSDEIDPFDTFSCLFDWLETMEGEDFWDKIDTQIFNNTPIVE